MLGLCMPCFSDVYANVSIHVIQMYPKIRFTHLYIGKTIMRGRFSKSEATPVLFKNMALDT